MTYNVILSMDAAEDVLRITMASSSKSEVVSAAKQLPLPAIYNYHEGHKAHEESKDQSV